MKIREDFEAACKQHAIDAGFPEYDYGFERSSEDANCYSDSHTQAAWWAWQTSRATLVIELPPSPSVPEDPEEAIDDSHMDAYHSAIGMRHACAKFIEAGGVKVKL